MKTGYIGTIALSSIFLFPGCAKVEESLQCKAFDALEITHQRAILAISKTPPQSICKAQDGSLLIVVNQTKILQNRSIPFDPQEAERKKKDKDQTIIVPIGNSILFF